MWHQKEETCAMRWNSRQLAMLREMGVHLWQPHHSEETPAAEPDRGSQTHAPEVLRAPSTAAVARDPAHPALQASAAPAVQPSQPATMPAGITGMDWEQLRSAVESCTACRLCQGRTQTVFGIGNVQAHWMIVGEAPGEHEDLQGEPFVGKSGQLLDAMLRAIGLTRGEALPQRQVYIANTVKCRPPGNRNPQPDELMRCEPFLIQQLALLKPRIILAMGKFAVQSLLRSDEPVGRLRGHVHHFQGVPLIVTYHPAYLLRNPQDKARAWDDLCLAVETAKALP